MKIIIAKNLSKKFSLSSLKRPHASLKKILSQKFSSLFTFKNQKNEEDFWALKDINFEIEEGDKVAIIGSNGAGKSTLLKIIARVTDPTLGEITLPKRVASLLEVGSGFHPDLSGRENIYFYGAIMGMKYAEIKKKFDEIVDFAEVENFIDTPVKKYSSGMHMRLGFSVAAHLDSELLILDEFLAVGDAHFQQKCLSKVEEFNQRGKTILFVSHDAKAVSSLCNKGMILKQGQLQFYGKMEDFHK